METPASPPALIPDNEESTPPVDMGKVDAYLTEGKYDYIDLEYAKGGERFQIEIQKASKPDQFTVTRGRWDFVRDRFVARTRADVKGPRLLQLIAGISGSVRYVQIEFIDGREPLFMGDAQFDPRPTITPV